MISFEAALQNVLDHSSYWGDESVSLLESTGRVLVDNIRADRDFPPFDRSTKDGIALNFTAIEKGLDRFKIEGVLSAGMAQQTLSSTANCFEIMTGAVLPKHTDTIVMYEDINIKDGWASISKTPVKNQNIHTQGSDKIAGDILVARGNIITAAIIGVLASVGKNEVLVKKLPNVCVVSTGDELVEVYEQPLPHQIRKSNTLSLTAALQQVKIVPNQLHLPDNRQQIERELKQVLEHHDVLLLSGGVSKGKFDFIPNALERLGVKKVFDRVAQRPGKPFWFGVLKNDNKVVFSFPGNPVSTFVTYHVYFLSWLAKSFGIDIKRQIVLMDNSVRPHPTLALLLQVHTYWQNGQLHAKLIPNNGSGDLISLANADGFISVPPGETELAEESEFWYLPST